MTQIMNKFLPNFQESVRQSVRQERNEVMSMLKVILETFQLVRYFEQYHPEKKSVLRFL